MKKEIYYDIEGYHIPRLPKLSKEEEFELIERYKNGDRDAGIKIVEHNYGLVVSVCKDFLNNNEDLKADLFQEGCIGIMKALDNFDTKFNCRFSTYAFYYIRNRVIKYLNNNSQIFSISLGYASLVSKIKRCEDYLFVKLKRNPTLEEVSEELGINIELLKSLKICFSKTVSFDDQVFLNDEQQYICLSEIVPSDQELLEDRIHKKLDDESDINILLNIVNSWDTVSDRDKNIFLDFYFGEYKVTKTEVAHKYNLSMERISQICKHLMQKMRWDLCNKIDENSRKHFLKN